MEEPYVSALLREATLYRSLTEEPLLLSELHLGGGTPTFFQPSTFRKFFSEFFTRFQVPKGPSYSFEAHPNTTTEEHLATLREFKFKRVSFGIQDFDHKVQSAINRIQSEKQVTKVTQLARDLGYNSINFDLIYGLPFQTLDSMTKTFQIVADLKPERIAFYSYAHVPWIKPSQRKFSEKDLPSAEYKRALYLKGKELLLAEGYIEIGMDHFALEHDEIAVALRNKTLHRNFMGYTTQNADALIGLGVSSIGDSWTCFGQNTKNLEEYYSLIASDRFPIVHGHLLTSEEKIIRKHILNLMCFQKTQWSDDDETVMVEGIERLRELATDGLVTTEHRTVTVTEAGMPFLRNVCMAIDKTLWTGQSKEKVFSATI